MSFGAESMEDGDLTRIGRPGTVDETVDAVTRARAAGFTNINHRLDVWASQAKVWRAGSGHSPTVLRWNPHHLSCYALTIEEDTKLESEIRRRLSPAPDEGLQIEMDEAAQGMLGDAGYERYEVSNYAKPGGMPAGTICSIGPMANTLD